MTSPKTLNFAPLWQIAMMVVCISTVNAQIIRDVGSLQLNQMAFYDDAYGLGVGNDGRVVKTIDGGDYWQLTDNLAGSVNLTSVYIEPTSAMSYVGGFDGALLRSADKGQTWSSISLPFKLPVTDIYFSGDSLGFVVLAFNNDSYVLRTRDGGIHWTTLAHKDGFIDIEFTGPDAGYMIQTEYLYKTTDQGATWSMMKKEPQFDYFRGVDFITPEIGFLVSSTNTYKTINGGMNWNTQGPGATGTIRFINENTGYSSSAYGDLSKTIDGGANWKVILKSPLVNSRPIAFAAIDESTAFYQNYETGNMYRTTNGGDEWVFNIGKPRANTALPSYMQVMGSDALFCVRGDSTLLRTDNGGVYWKSQMIGTERLNSIFFVNDLKGFMAGENGAYYVTENGGTDWTRKSLGKDTELFYVGFTDELHGVMTGEHASFFTTINGGASWTDVSLDLPDGLNIFKGGMVDEKTFYAITAGNGRIDQGFYKTADAGLHWKFLPNDWINQLSDGYMPDSLNISIVGASGLFMSSSDGGKHYSQRGETGYSISSMHFPGNKVLGFATGQHGDLLKTTDIGKSWNLVTSKNIYFDLVRMQSDSTGYLSSFGETFRVGCDLSHHFIKGNFYDLCPGMEYWYSVSQYPNVNWSVAGGTIKSQDQFMVSVVWDAGGEQSLKASISGTGCETTRSITQEIKTKVLPASPISGPKEVCVGAAAYHIDNPVGRVNYTWTPTDGGGTITDDRSLDWAIVHWKSAGVYTLKLLSNDTYCLHQRLDSIQVVVHADAFAWYEDADGDGAGDINNVVNSCSQPAGFVLNSTDCNDDNAAIQTCVTAIDDDVNESSVYPNPCSSLCHLDFQNVDVILLYDVYGRFLARYPATCTMDATGLPSGIYYITAGQNTTRMVVVH